VTGASEVSIDPAFATALKNTVNNPRGVDIGIKVYASDSDSATLAANTDAAFVAAGYTYVDAAGAGVTKLSIPTGSTSGTGFYTKSGTPDVIATIGSVEDMTKNPPSGVDTALYQRFVDQVKNKKSGLFIISAKGVVAGIVASNNATATAVTQPALNPTATPATIADPVKITLDPAVTTAIEKNVTGVKDLQVQLFVSDDQPEHLAATTEASLLQSGYKFAIAGGTTFVKDGTAYSGGYSKVAAPDILFNIATLSDDAAQLAANMQDFGVPALNPATQPQLAAQFKGHKSAILVLSGTDLIKAISGVVVAATPSNTTPLATTTSPSTSNDLTEITVDPAIQAGFAKQLPSITDLKVQIFVSPTTTATDLATTIDTALLKDGYKFALPDHTKIYTDATGQSYAGGYAKAGTADLVLGITDVSGDSSQLVANIQELHIPGIDQADGAKFAAQIQGKKALLIMVSGTGLIKSLNP
jgi:hypothetical protein